MIRYRSELFFLTVITLWIAFTISAETWPEHRHVFGAISLVTLGVVFVLSVIVILMIVRKQMNREPAKKSRVSISETIKQGYEKGRGKS